MPVRSAVLEDASKIAEAHISSWQSAYRGIISDSTLENLSIEKSKRLWEKLILEGQGEILVYQKNQEVVGFISYGETRDEESDKTKTAEIYAIYISPQSYRKGFGSALLNRALNSLQKKEYEIVTLWVLTQNSAGRKFYEALGFTTTGRVKVESLRDGSKIHETQYSVEFWNN